MERAEKTGPGGLPANALVVETVVVAPAPKTVELETELEVDVCAVVVVLEVTIDWLAGFAGPEFKYWAAEPTTPQPARDVVTMANANRPAKATLNLSKRKPKR